MTFNEKVVLITGASSGIGKAIAKTIVREDCRLIITARRLELLEELAQNLPIGKEKLLVLKCDVSDKTEVANACKLAIEKFGKIDVAILNAGVGHSVTPENYDSKFAEEIFGANVMGIIYWIEQLLPDFLKRREGIIAGVSSLADNRGFSGSGFYCASKAAASIYLEGLRVELKPRGVKVITIKPGFVKTPMTDKNNFEMPFLMDADKAAQIIIEGIKKEKRIIKFPLPTVVSSQIVGILPGGFYEWLAGKIKV